MLSAGAASVQRRAINVQRSVIKNLAFSGQRSAIRRVRTICYPDRGRTETPAVKTACATKLYPASDPISREPNYNHYLFGDQVQKHEAQYAARARAAIEAGLEPPPYEPLELKNVETEAKRRDKEWRAEIEKNREAGRLRWNELYPDNQVEYTPYLTWGEQEDLRLAELKRLREQEANSQQPIAIRD
jgi:hypothetical protein